MQSVFGTVAFIVGMLIQTLLNACEHNTSGKKIKSTCVLCY